MPAKYRLQVMDFTVNLDTLGFECGLCKNEKDVLFLRARSAGLTICGCGHAVFVCKLAHSLRESIQRQSPDSLASDVSREDGGLNVGVLGGGHIGKQFVQVLLENTGIKPSHINISTRRPETLEEFAKMGIGCYFDNRRLVSWAHVLFLCVLPCQVPEVCAELHSHLPQHCLLYTFTSAVPVKRLAKLLGHNFILKPQYDYAVCGSAGVWLSQRHLPKALKDPRLIESSSPLSLAGGLSLDQKWVSGLFYCLLNFCTSASVGSSEALALINALFQLKASSTTRFTQRSFISSSYAYSLAPDEYFPWINLIDAQTKETPLSRFISRNNAVQDCISAVYTSSLADPLEGKETERMTGMCCP